MYDNFGICYKKKIDEIEQNRMKEIIEIKRVLAGVKKKKCFLGVILITIFLVSCWPIFKFGGIIANLLMIVPCGYVYKFGSRKFEKSGNDNTESYTSMIRRYAQLSLAGSLHENHRKLFDYGPESIGAMFEVYCGLKYEYLGYSVEYKGLMYRQFDQGVDLICKKKYQTLLVQCKYWKRQSKIPINTVQKLHEAAVKEMVNSEAEHEVRGVIITSSQLTEDAKDIAVKGNIDFLENQKMSFVDK